MGPTGTHGDPLEHIGTHWDLLGPNAIKSDPLAEGGGGFHITLWTYGDPLGPMGTHRDPLDPTWYESSLDLTQPNVTH